MTAPEGMPRAAAAPASSRLWRGFDAFTSRLFFRRQFFPQGWGDISALADNYRLGVARPRWEDAETLAAFRQALLHTAVPARIEIDWARERRYPGGTVVRRGQFAAPANAALLPEPSRTAHVEWIAPAGHDISMPVCVLFPATGEQGFLSRRLLALALARRGIASLVLEVPFYGVRRPPEQRGALLNHVSDLIALMDSTVAEGRALLAWLQRQGYTRLGVSGISMGGSVSALVTARSAFPLDCIGMIPANAVGPVYAEGLLSDYVAWDGLQAALPPGDDARALLHAWLGVFDVTNFPRPVAERRARFLSAVDDGCIPRHNTDALHRHWPQARVDWLAGGHSSAAITGWNRYRQAIVDTLAPPR